ncbi:MAG: DUF2218 domain-containing protein [Pseudomonadota bacterium]
MCTNTTSPTDQAGRRLAAQCKHFALKARVTQNAASGRVVFPFGHYDTVARAQGLSLTVSAADQGQIDRVVTTSTCHAERFAFCETPFLDWQADATDQNAPSGQI